MSGVTLPRLKKSSSTVAFKYWLLCIVLTAGIGRMGPPAKVDLFSMGDFVVFSIITIIMYVVLVGYDGNAVY